MGTIVIHFDKIKLDQSFVRDLAEKNEAAAIVQVVAELGRSLQITTVAEGVETQQQFERLRESGFSEVQGYLFSAAIPAAEVAGYIARKHGLSAAA
jgi:EAL domain-containing protein (putative c-di-GMP-specific phosphodiesterase class I)